MFFFISKSVYAFSYLENGELVAPVRVPNDGLGDVDDEQSGQQGLEKLLLGRGKLPEIGEEGSFHFWMSEFRI